MIIPRESRPREVLERIAADYRKRGYDVVVQPGGRDLPDFLADTSPDIIARRPGENLVIEVKRAPRDVDPDQLNAISRQVSKEPGWQFVVIAESTAESPLDRLAPLDETTVRERLRQAEELLQRNYVEAALLVAWAATEAAVRLLIARYGLPLSRDDTPSLIRTLASEGYLEDDVFRRLNNAFRLRSALAHGQRPVEQEVTAEAKATAEQLTRISQSLLKELPAGP